MRLVIDGQQDARRAVAQHKYGGQHQRRNFADGALDRFGFQSGAPGGAIVECDPQPAVGNRQTSEQRLAADGAAMVSREVQQ